MGNFNCKNFGFQNTSQQDIYGNDILDTKNDQQTQQIPPTNTIRASFEIPIQNNDTLMILTPTRNKSIDFSQDEPINNVLTDNGPQKMLPQQQSSIGTLTPIRKQSTMKHSEGRKMPLEVIDEINGEMINIKTYDAVPPQKTCPNVKNYKNLQTSSTVTRYKKKVWRDLKVTSIIPEDKLKHAGENDILLQGEFYKFTKENDLKKIDATSKYLILTRSELRIYRSKEIVLHMLSPLQRISLFNISQCDIINVPNNKKSKNLCQFNFCIEFITVNGMKIDGDDKLSTNSSHQLDNSLNKKRNNGIILTSIENVLPKDKTSMKSNKGKKIQLIPVEEKNSEVNPKKNKLLFDNNSELIIFSSNNEDLVNRWVCVVNYFLAR